MLRRLWRSGRLAEPARQELRLFLLLLAGAPHPWARRRWSPATLRRGLKASAAGLDRAIQGLERRGWIRVTRASKMWLIEVTVGREAGSRRAQRSATRCGDLG